MKMFSFFKKYCGVAVACFLFLTPAITRASEATIGGDQQTFTASFSLGDFISALYTIGVMVVGATAFFAIVLAGLEYMTAAGNTTRTEDAKDRIRSAIYGMLLLLFATLLFNTINPAILQGSL